MPPDEGQGVAPSHRGSDLAARGGGKPHAVLEGWMEAGHADEGSGVLSRQETISITIEILALT